MPRHTKLTLNQILLMFTMSEFKLA